MILTSLCHRSSLQSLSQGRISSPETHSRNKTRAGADRYAISSQTSARQIYVLKLVIKQGHTQTNLLLHLHHCLANAFVHLVSSSVSSWFLRWRHVLCGLVRLRSQNVRWSHVQEGRPLPDHQQHVRMCPMCPLYQPWKLSCKYQTLVGCYTSSRWSLLCRCPAERETGGRLAPSTRGRTATSRAITWPLPTPSRLKSKALLLLLVTLLLHLRPLHRQTNGTGMISSHMACIRAHSPDINSLTTWEKPRNVISMLSPPGQLVNVSLIFNRKLLSPQLPFSRVFLQVVFW